MTTETISKASQRIRSVSDALLSKTKANRDLLLNLSRCGKTNRYEPSPWQRKSFAARNDDVSQRILLQQESIVKICLIFLWSA
jgi:hypothetical protein